MSTTPDPPQREAIARVLDVLTGSWRSTCLYLGVKHDLARHLRDAGKPVTVERLSELTGVTGDRLQRVLRVWADLGLVEQRRDAYLLPPLFECLADGVGIGDLVVLYEEDFRPAWSHADQWLTGSRTGFEAAYGLTIHDRIRDDKDFADRFMRGMGALDVVFSAFGEVARGEGSWSFLDIGGGRGDLARTVLAQDEMAVGTVFDLPHVVGARDSARGSDSRYSEIAGDFFDEVPRGYDCYVLSRILQDWGDARALQILANIRSAARPSGSALWVLERSVGPGRPLSNVWDVHLGCVAGGGERSREEYLRLFGRAGWTCDEVVDLPFETDAFRLSSS